VTHRKSQTTTQTYDALNRPITCTFADTSTRVYSWDGSNRLAWSVTLSEARYRFPGAVWSWISLQSSS